MPSFSSGRKDIIIIGALLLAALAVWGVYTLLNRTPEPEGVYAEIIYDGELVEKVYLSEDCVFSTEKLPNVTFEVKDEKIAFIESDCPDKVCIHTGWLDAGGHFASCLPNKVLLWVVEDESQSIDAVAQ